MSIVLSVLYILLMRCEVIFRCHSMPRFDVLCHIVSCSCLCSVCCSVLGCHRLLCDCCSVASVDAQMSLRRTFHQVTLLPCIKPQQQTHACFMACCPDRYESHRCRTTGFYHHWFIDRNGSPYRNFAVEICSLDFHSGGGAGLLFPANHLARRRSPGILFH